MVTAERSRPSEQQLTTGPASREQPSQDFFSPAWAIDQYRRYWKTFFELNRPISPPDWLTPNKVVDIERPNVILRNFTDGVSSNKSPILILPPQAGHSSVIADYNPGQSLVEVANRTGAPVYACEWPEATYERRHETIADFIEATGACVDAISKNGRGVTLIGLCQGGWQAAIYTALNPDKVDRLVLAGAPIDFHAGDGKIADFAETTPMSFFRWVVALGRGNTPGQFMLQSFKWMNPVERFIEDPLLLYRNIDDEKKVQRRRTLVNWYEDPHDIPGDFFIEIVEYLFKENRLIRGELKILGQNVDLSRITCPVTLLAGEDDDITPPDQLFNIRPHLGTKDVQVYLVKGGHIGLFTKHDVIENDWPDILKPQTAA